jgi:hypothetical protein
MQFLRSAIKSVMRQRILGWPKMIELPTIALRMLLNQQLATNYNSQYNKLASINGCRLLPFLAIICH